MATIQELYTRAVFRAEFVDDASAGAAAATAVIDKYNAAVGNGEPIVKRAGASAETFRKQKDDLAKTTLALQRAEEGLAAARIAHAAEAATNGAKEESYARAITKGAADVEILKNKLNDLKAAAAAAAGVGNVGTAAEIAAAKIAAMGGSSKATANEARMMGIQFVQGLSGIATGQPILTTFIQQGHQVVDVALSSGQGLRSLGTAFSGMIAPIGGFATLLGVGVVGAFAAFELAANHSIARLGEIRSALRGSQADYAALADTVEATGRRVAASSGLSVDAATKAAETLASNKYFSGTSSDLERLIRDAADLGRVLGGDAAKGAEKLSEGMLDTTKAAQALASGPNGLRTLNADVLRLIESYQNAGERGKAFATLLQAIEGVAKGTADDVSPLTKAWQELGNAFTGTQAKSGWFRDWLANDIAGAIKGVTEGINLLKAAMEGLNNLQTTLQNGARSMAGMGPMQTGTQGGQAQLTASDTKEAFVRNWLDAAKSAGQQLGVSPRSILGLWGNETNFGKNLYDNNPGNIQAGSNYEGRTTVRGDTHADGSAYKTQFRAYDDKDSFVADFVKLLQNPRYAGALNTNDNALAFGGGLRRGSYMEDASAPSKIAAAAASIQIPDGMVNNAKALNDEFKGWTENTNAFKAAALDQALDKNNKLMVSVAASAGTDSQEYQALVEKQRDLTGQRYKLVDAEVAAQRAADSSLASTKGLTAGEQGLSAAIERRRQIYLNAGMEFSDTAKQAATIEFYRGQSQELDRVASSMGEVQHNNEQMASAYDKGNEAVLKATASQQAYTEARKHFADGTVEQAQAVEVLTKSFEDNARTAADMATAQQNMGSRDNLAFIEAQTSSIGMNEDARQKLIATMRAEQEMHRKYGDILPAEAQEYIRLAGATVEAQAKLTQMQNSYTDFQNIGVNAFNAVGDAIVEAMANGSKKTIDFGDVFRGVLTSILKQLAQLAVINPILNTLFGGQRSTLDSALGFGAVAAGALGGMDNGAGSGVGGAQMPDAGGAGSIMSLGGLKTVYDLGRLAVGGPSVAESAVAGVTGFFGNASSATNLALDAAGPGVYGVATAGQLGIASAGEAIGLGAEGVGAITEGVSMISSALPYIGTAVGVISDIAQGNYRGAGMIAAGALIGSFVPGVGTAIGAVVGGLLDSFLPNHKKNPYQTTGVEIEDGRLARGPTYSQLEDPSAAIAAVDDFASGINKYLDQVHLLISNPNGLLGAIGDNVTGFEQTDNPSKLFERLSFRPDDSSDKNSNYYKAAFSALDQTKFANPQELQEQMLKIVAFSNGLDAFGIKLATTGQRLTDIKIEEVLLPDANKFRTALAHDLPGQTFKDTDAFFAEIQKVNQFVNGTLPSLLNPVLDTTTDLQKQIQAMVHTYADAIDQAQKYGLATEDLTAAQGKAIELLQASAVRDLAVSNAGIAKRGASARGEDTTQYDLQAFDLQAEAQREQLKQAYINIYGSLIPPAKEYGAAALTLDRTLDAERLALLRKSNGDIIGSETQRVQAEVKLIADQRALWDKNFSVLDKFNSIRARQSAVMGDNKDAELLNFDDAAQREAMDYARQLVDTYGNAFYQTTDYNNRMSELWTVQQEERLAIIKKYGDQQTEAARQAAEQQAAAQKQALESAQQQVGGVITSLTDYARTLRVGADSPLSANAQYGVARSQFQAVQGAARAGDFESASKLQSYAQSFLQASRAVNGSGTGYASDFNSVLSALQGVTAAGADALTNSAMLAATQSQTVALSSKFDELKAELVALRREYQQQARKAA